MTDNLMTLARDLLWLESQAQRLRVSLTDLHGAFTRGWTKATIEQAHDGAELFVDQRTM